MNKRLREARNALNLRQKDFAEKLFLKLSSYANWESGCSPIPQAKIPLICSTFGINEEWLRSGKGEMFAKQTEAANETARSKRAIAEQYLLEKFRELSPELQTDVLGFCSFLIDQNAKHLKKCLDEVADASSVDGDVGDNQPS